MCICCEHCAWFCLFNKRLKKIVVTAFKRYLFQPFSIYVTALGPGVIVLKLPFLYFISRPVMVASRALSLTKWSKKQAHYSTAPCAIYLAWAGPRISYSQPKYADTSCVTFLGRSSHFNSKALHVPDQPGLGQLLLAKRF